MSSVSTEADEDPGERAWKAKSEKAQARVADEVPATTRKRGKRRAGEKSSVAIDGPTADMLDELVALYSESSGFTLDRIAVVGKLIKGDHYVQTGLRADREARAKERAT